MRYKSHLIAGLASSYIAVTPAIEKINIAQTPVVVIVFTSGALLGSIFPDIDEEGSFIANRLKSVVHWFFRHRGMFHYPLYSLLVFFLLNEMALNFNLPLISVFLHGFIVGEFSHFVLDTPEGIRWLHPIAGRCILKVTPGKYKTPFVVKIKNFITDIGYMALIFIGVNYLIK